MSLRGNPTPTQSHCVGWDREEAVRYCTSPVSREGPSFNVGTHVDGAAVPCVLVFNGGSSSIRFAVFEAGPVLGAGHTLRRRLDGKIDRIGSSDATFIVNDASRNAQAANVISTDASRATVRVIRTDEELMIARSVLRVGHQQGSRGCES